MLTSLKTCRRCQQVLPLGEFYVHAAMADGHLNFCKRCVRVRVGNHRARNEERIREYDRSRATQPKRVATNVRSTRRFRRRHPDGYAAHMAVSNAIRDGKLTRGRCEVCDAAAADAHHRDYSRPFAITWLCTVHRNALRTGKLLLPLTA